MRQAIVSISPDILRAVFHLDHTTRFVEARMSDAHGNFRFVVESDKLPDVPDGHLLPEAVIICTRTEPKGEVVPC